VCCRVIQCVTVCCSLLQCVAVCCSVMQCDAVRRSMLYCVAVLRHQVYYCIQLKPAVAGENMRFTTVFILQAPPNLHPFVWRVYFNTCLLVRIPGLFCVRGMFKIFVGKNCQICQLYWCFHQLICSKPRQRDLRNCPQHLKRDLSKGDTV